MELRLVTYHIGRDIPGIPIERIAGIPWYRKLEAGPSWHKPYLDLLLLLKALKVARTFRPHLIHAHIHEGAFIGTILKENAPGAAALRLPGEPHREITDHGFVRTGRSCSASLPYWSADQSGADYIITSSEPHREAPGSRRRAAEPGAAALGRGRHGVFAPQPKGGDPGAAGASRWSPDRLLPRRSERLPGGGPAPGGGGPPEGAGGEGFTF